MNNPRHDAICLIGNIQAEEEWAEASDLATHREAEFLKLLTRARELLAVGFHIELCPMCKHPMVARWSCPAHREFVDGKGA